MRGWRVSDAMTQPRKPRTIEPQRDQVEIRFALPSEDIAPTHPARVLWEVLGRVDLSAFDEGARAVEGRPGRPRTSSRMLLTLWTYSVSRGIGSAREIARLTRSDAALRWITGGRAASHQTLSRFRVGHPTALDALMTDVLASLMHKGVLSLELVAQDGMRVRGSASAPSFRSHASLLECREQATLHLKAVLALSDPEITEHQKARRIAAARDFQRRVEDAIETVETLQRERGPSGPPARASTTDCEARVMKMADGGFRPALNLRAVTAGSEMGGPRTIIAVQLCNVGSDMNAIKPLLDEVERRLGMVPKRLLADANHASHSDLKAAAARGVEVLVPVPKRSQNAGAKRDQDPAIEEWRLRMNDPEAKRVYRARASLCELTNAHLRHRGLTQFLVRGVAKATCVAMIAAIAGNLLAHSATLLA